MRALENATDLELSGDDAHSLIALIQELAVLQEREHLMRLVRTAARRLTGADGVTFVLKEGDTVFYADEDALAPLWRGQRFPVKACVSGWVIEHREPALIPNVFADPRVPKQAYVSTFVKSMAMVPIRTSAPVGALGAYWAQVRHPTVREVALLATIADAASVALQNLELFNRERDARQAAEAEVRLRQELLSIVSHDLRSPLSAISMAASLLSPLIVPLNGRARHHLELIARSTRRIDGLIHDLLDFASIEGGHLRVAPKVVAVGEVVAQVSDFLPLAQERGIALDLETGWEGTLVSADLDRMHQVFSNLIGNSLKFTPSGGSIRVGVDVRPENVAFQVMDTGPGFPNEQLGTVFERKGRTTSSVGQGIGLGLSIAKGIVQAHGGTIHALNGSSGGAVVRFELPKIH